MAFIEVPAAEADRWRCPFCGKNNPIGKTVCDRPRKKQKGAGICGYDLNVHGANPHYSQPQFLKIERKNGADTWYKNCTWYKPGMEKWRSSTNRGK